MDMSIPKVNGQSVVAATSEINKKNSATKQKASHDDEDTVNISERGKQLAKNAETGSGGGMEVNGEVNAEDLQQELQKTQKEVASVKDEIETLKRQAETDPIKRAELGKKKSKLRDLEDAASDIKTKVYT